MIGKELIKGMIKPIVFQMLLKKERMYGYEITQVLDETTGGRIKLTFAALYPVLHKLEAEGMVKTETENVNNRIRKYYSLTGKGRKESEIRGDEIRDYLKLMTKLFNQ